MSLAPRELTPPSPELDGELEVDLLTEGLPPLLAEIAAQSPWDTNGRSGREQCDPGKTVARKRAKRRRSQSRWRSRALSPGEVVVGRLAGLNDAGEPLVRHPLDSSGRVVLARTTVPVDKSQIDREVVLAFERGDVTKPIVLGVLWRSGETPAADSPASRPTVSRPIVEATLDGETLVLNAEQEIVLRCGKASLTLTRAGKVLIRGTYLLSRSSGVNRIKGGSVQIN